MDRLQLQAQSYAEIPPVLYQSALAKQRLNDLLLIDLSNNDIEWLPEQQYRLSRPNNSETQNSTTTLDRATEQREEDEDRKRLQRLILLKQRSVGGDFFFYLPSLQKLDISRNKLRSLPVSTACSCLPSVLIPFVLCSPA